MLHPPQHRALTGAVCRDAKRRTTSSTHWMHLSQAEVNNCTTLQLVTAVHLVSAEAYAVTIQKLLLLLCLLWHRIIGGPNGNPIAESVVVTSLYFAQVNYRVFVNYVQRWFLLDAYLHDITPLELTRSNALTLPRNLRLATWDDAECYHYTGFNNSQLHRIYRCFDLDGILVQTQLPYIQVTTRQTDQRGVVCCYNFDPEEFFCLA